TARVCDVAMGLVPHFDDARGDVHALGAILFALLSGSRSDEDASVDALAPWVDARIVEIVRCASAPDPARRFASAIALGEALRAIPGAADPLEASRIAPVSSELRGTRSSSSTDERPASSRSADPLIGHRLGGRYTIVRELGRSC